MTNELSMIIMKGAFIPFFGKTETQSCTWPEPQRSFILDLIDAINYACEYLPAKYIMTFSTDDDLSDTWLMVYGPDGNPIDIDELILAVFESLPNFDQIMFAADLAIEDVKNDRKRRFDGK